jgi:hypothetical protein
MQTIVAILFKTRSNSTCKLVWERLVIQHIINAGNTSPAQTIYKLEIHKTGIYNIKFTCFGLLPQYDDNTNASLRLLKKLIPDLYQ